MAKEEEKRAPMMPRHFPCRHSGRSALATNSIEVFVGVSSLNGGHNTDQKALYSLS